MKDFVYFTKFNIHWGYNNIHIKESNQWKAAFITPFGLFKPTIIFFGFCNAPHLPGICESHLLWYGCRKMAQDLYGWPWYPYLWHPLSSSQSNLTSSSTTLGIWTVIEDHQMLLQHPYDGILGSDHQPRASMNGSHQAIHHLLLETPHFDQRHLFIPQIYQFLLQIHPQLLQHCCPSHGPHSQGYHLGLDFTLSIIFWHSQGYLHHFPYPHNSWHFSPPPYHIWHFPPCCWHCSYVEGHQWQPSLLCLFLQDFLSCGIKL